jgi:hypothetical protein
MHTMLRIAPMAPGSKSSSKHYRMAARRHSRRLLAGIQPHGYPVGARAWIPAKSLRE